MKKAFILSLLSILAIILLAACGNSRTSENVDQNVDSSKEVKTNEAKSNEETYELTEEGIIKPEIAKKEIAQTAADLMEAISKKDSAKIAQFVHPVKGVRFTPYTHVSIDHDIVMGQAEIKTFFENKKVFLWGNYDGSGKEISLTPSEYYKEFIYSADFLNAEKIGYNEVLSGGNIEENQFKVYENAIVVEYYFPGFNPEYGGADWQSLRLVFERYEDSWKLVGIIHNQMTL